MSASALSASVDRVPALTLLADFITLTKPRIAVLVLITTAVAAHVASWGQVDPWILTLTLLGTAGFAASASALNQRAEIRQDGLMRRTQNRPLPAGRLSEMSVVIFAGATFVIGLAVLAGGVNLASAGWGFATWAIYVLSYTPMKTRSAANTAVGAVSGALPVLIGWASTGAELDYRAGSLTLLLFLWQFPHFMAIAWLYRHEYDKAGFRMLTTVDPSGFRAGIQAVLAGAALIPISLLPALGLPTPVAVWYMVAVYSFGVTQLATAVLFLVRRDDWSARWLLRASLIYLPSVLLLLLFFPWA